MQNQTEQKSAWTYSEMVGALLRQERGSNTSKPMSVIEQITTQLEAGKSIEAMTLDLTELVSCPDCEPGSPCPSCRSDQAEMDREIRDHLRRVQASGTDLVTYLKEADQFHALWQDRFEHLHLAVMGGEALC